jgi:hypothetical protein
MKASVFQERLFHGWPRELTEKMTPGRRLPVDDLELFFRASLKIWTMYRTL